MKAKGILNRQNNSQAEPKGFYFEAYTPINGQIISPSLNKQIAHANMYLSVDSTVTFVDAAGNLVTAFPLKAGKQDFLVREIRSSSAGSVAIIHDGVLASTEETYTSAVYE